MRFENWFRTVHLKLRSLFLRRELDLDLNEELLDHLESKTRVYIVRGLPPQQARRQALIDLRGLDQTKERCRDARGTHFLDTLLQDIRFAFRMLRKSPGFTAVAVLTLALGIGANTTIFSLINAVLFKSLPVRDPQHLFLLEWRAHHSPREAGMSSYGDCIANFRQTDSSSCLFTKPFFTDLQGQTSVFSGVATFSAAPSLKLTDGSKSRVNGYFVTGDFFPTTGIRAAAGRLIAPADDTASSQPVVVLRYGFWQSAFGGSPSAIGKTISLNNVSFQVIGVADAGFIGISPGRKNDMWLPMAMLPQMTAGWQSSQEDATHWWLPIIARVKDGIPTAQAQAAVDTLFRNAMLHGELVQFQQADDPHVALVPAQQGLTGSRERYSNQLVFLMLVVGIILLIACANVAGLLLSRAVTRQKEMAVRLAIGAGRVRIVRQLLTESVVMSMIAGAIGVLFSIWGSHAIVSLMSNSGAYSLGFDFGIDGWVLGFTLAVSVLTGVFFGLVPALAGTRIDLTPMLKESSASNFSEGRSHGTRLSLGNVLVIGQVALAFVVLVGAGLLVRTFENLRTKDLGFDANNVLLFDVNPERSGYKPADIRSLFTDLQGRLRAIPSVTSVSYSEMPIVGRGMVSNDFQLPGSSASAEASMLEVGPNFFETMGIPLLAGRDFTPADFAVVERAMLKQSAASVPSVAGMPAMPSNTSKSSPPQQPESVVVNEAFVRKFLGTKSALGVRLNDYVIVGVVRDTKYYNPRNVVGPTVFLPQSNLFASFELRTTTKPEAIVSAVREAVGEINKNLSISGVAKQTQLIDGMLVQERMVARLSSFFGVLALILACIGLYGLLSYEVSRRTREIGIRVALGAQPGSLLALVIFRGVMLAITGAAAGIGVAFGVMRYLQSMLYDVQATDPMTLIFVTLVLLVVAVLACYIPARRAMRVDPTVALRYE